MNLGSLGAGLGAVGPGFLQGRAQLGQVEQQDIANADAQAKQVGMAAYFRALQQLTGGAGGPAPQPPAPGQPSMPTPQAQPAVLNAGGQPARPDARGVYGADAVMMPASAPAAPQPPVMAAGGAPAAPGGQQQMTWGSIAQAVKAANPGIDDVALAHAVDKFVPMMNMQAQAEWRNIRSEVMERIANVRADAWRDTANTRAGAQVAAAETRADVSRDSLEERRRQFDQREGRLADALQFRKDSTWLRLDQQKQALEQRVRQGDRKQALSEWRGIVDAQHKRAMEIIQTQNINNAATPDAKKQQIKEQNDWYNAEIERMRGLSTQRGNLTDGPPPTGMEVVDAPVAPPAARAPAAPARPAPVEAAPPATAAPAPVLPPPEAIQALKEGVVTTFGNGQKWTLEGGQPKQVP